MSSLFCLIITLTEIVKLVLNKREQCRSLKTM